ncbi:hypothetical protein [Thiobaca trueperi]|uniref:Uncharacterized protein n=1 Tax=Thiobaca trueperi TaxID=127458 RepID=A0A4R3N5H5_9GAMM|nr:hypothetical protein [Thiobaca trueperi]TCT24285.1 hypothetical protein EDC35_101607 [Thiobaca trueperi]
MLGWLAAVWSGHLDDESTEPLVPPGLAEMDGAISQAYIQPMLIMIETPLFQKQWPLYWTEDERGSFAAYIAENPDAGDVIPDSEGCLRHAGDGLRDLIVCIP